MKALLFGGIGLVIAVVVRVLIWFVPAVFRGTHDSRFQVGAKLLHEPLFLLIAVACIGLGVYLGRS